MIKIINKRKYDTDTAEELLTYSNGYSTSNFQHYTETLYRKRTGEFFLYGEGGPTSRYAERLENLLMSGSKIVPLTDDEAREWVADHFDGEDYIEIFGDVEE